MIKVKLGESRKITFKTTKSVLMVFCDREYEFSDYIEDYKNFLKVIKKK